MANVLHLDDTSLLVSAQVGITMAALEAQLAERGLTLGALPSWSRERTLGALLSAPRPAEASPRLGRFTQACVGLGAILADGTELQTRIAPRKATGPDLMHVLVGARGTLGLITAASIRIHRRQEARLEAAFRLPSLPAALATARALLVRGGRPADLSVAPLAAGRSPSAPTGASAACLSLQVDGPEPLVDAERALAEALAREHGGEPMPFAPPPRITTAPHERAVAIDTVDHEVLAADLLGDALRIVGWHPAGACVIDRQRPPAPPAPPSPLWAGLKRRLDPDRRFADWPGA
jgi:FAD/FMN-containing dehydrogenase